MSCLLINTSDTEGLRAAVQRSVQEDPGSIKGEDRGLFFIFLGIRNPWKYLILLEINVY